MVDYATLLEKYCRYAPYNWFNFFDVWRGRHHIGDARIKP
jgi:predicted LPLAT superfamily acyltransferase